MLPHAVLASIYDRLHHSASAVGFGLASFRQPSRADDWRTLQNIRRRRELLLTPLEAAQLLYCVRATTHLGGDMAEVGVYRGASARVIRAGDTSRPLHLFDTFTGLPPTTDADTEFRQGQFREGQFAADLDDVRAYLSDLSGLSFYAGLFPETGSPVSDRRFSFVHLDVDLYASTRDALAWFYPRLIPGAIMLSHDVASCEGPRRAFAEFRSAHPDPVLDLPGNQALVVKIAH